MTHDWAVVVCCGCVGICACVLQLLGGIIRNQERLFVNFAQLRNIHRQEASFRSKQHLDAIDMIAQLARAQGVHLQITKEGTETKH